MEVTIKDFSGKTLGYIVNDSSGNKTAYDFSRKVLGTYNKSSNATKDFYGRIIAYGDVLSHLIMKANNL